MALDPYGQSNHFLNTPEPPEADNVAARGTPQWRDAMAKRQEWKANLIARSGGAGDPKKAADILGDFTARTATETGDELRKKIAQNRRIAEELSSDATNRLKMAEDRQWWAGGGGRGLNEDEMSSLRDVTGWEGEGQLAPNQGIKGIPRHILEQWQKGVKSGKSVGGSVGSGGQDMWPGNTGMEGSLPSYAAPQYNPVDSWGGWSGVYGNQQNPGNPAGLGQAPIPVPAALGGSQMGGQTPQMGGGVTNTQGMPNPVNPVQLGVTPGMNRNRPMRGRRRSGGGMGQPSIGVVDPMRPNTGPTAQGMLIRRG